MANTIGSDFSALFTQDSEEVQEMFCEHCDKHDKQYVPAEGFCEECLEYLCGNCLKFHQRYMPTHAIKDKDNMPQDFCLEKCPIHQDELTKFYCEACKKFACTKCKTKDHRNCIIVSHLPALVRGIEKSQEIKELTENLEEFMKTMENTEEQVNINMKNVASQETKILETIKKKKTEILAAFEKHKKETVQDFQKKIEETLIRLNQEMEEICLKLYRNTEILEKSLNDEENEIVKMIGIMKNIDNIILQTITKETSEKKSKLKTVSTQVAHYQNTDQRCQLFVAMKKGQEIIDQLKPDAEKLWENNTIYYYKVECKSSVQDVINIQDSGKIFTFQTIQQSEVERAASHYTDIEFTYDSCNSLCLLSENCLLITHYDSTELIIFKDMSVSTTSYDRIDLPSEPWAVAKVDNNKAAVTFPELRILRLITFSKCMTVTNTEDIKVGELCHGVAYSNNKFIVSYITNPAAVKILDMSGKVLQTFDKDHHGNCLFDNPCYLTVSPDNTVIYISDSGKNCVIGLTIYGKVKAIYNNDMLKEPCQLTVDRSGAVFVCGFLSDNIHQVTSDPTKADILLDKEQKIFRPRGVAFCQNTNRLYVCQRRQNITVYDLIYHWNKTIPIVHCNKTIPIVHCNKTIPIVLNRNSILKKKNTHRNRRFLKK